jgi:hypothetical protein
VENFQSQRQKVDKISNVRKTLNRKKKKNQMKIIHLSDIKVEIKNVSGIRK